MIKLFLDMDGTIAKFNSKRKALERFKTEKSFFANLKPFKYIEEVNKLITSEIAEVYVISASPNAQADSDKLTWLNTYLPNLTIDRICFCRIGENKAIEIKRQLNIDIDESCLLLDDFTNNLIEWKNSKGIGIKRITSLANNKSKRWKGYCLKNLNELSNLVKEIAEVIG